MLLFLVVLVTAAACRKDLGNYTYNEINNAEISGLNDSYTVFRSQVLEITPNLSFSKTAETADNYSYEWFCIDFSTSSVTKTTISTTRNLKWPVNLPSTNIDYAIYLQVTEKATGQTWRKSVKLRVNTNVNDGWLVLNDDNGKARLDFLNYQEATAKFDHITDVLATQSKIVLNGAPKMLYFYNRLNNLVSGQRYRCIVVGTDKTSYFINTHNNSFDTYGQMTDVMSVFIPPPYYAQKMATMNKVTPGTPCYMYDSNGNLLFEDNTSGYNFGITVNRTSAGGPFKMSPYFAASNNETYLGALMYDVDNKRFYQHVRSNTTSSVVPTKPDSWTSYDPANMGMDLLYMALVSKYSGGQVFALLKNSAGKVFLTRILFDAGATAANVFLPQSYQEVTDIAPEIANATQFAIHQTEGYIMYQVGSKVYRYSLADNSNKLVVDAGSKKISLIKFQRMTNGGGNTARIAAYQDKLMVCTYDEANPSTSGQIDLYNVPPLNGDVTLFESYTGFAKIVDVSYREP